MLTLCLFALAQEAAALPAHHTTFDAPTAAPWRAVVRDLADERRIVGLGECSHYTKECYDLKGAALEELFGLGFAGLALEVDFGEALRWNEFVLGGEGEARELLARSGWFTYRTEEFAAILESIRAANADRDVPIEVFGIEMTSVQEGLVWLTRTLEESGAFDDEEGRALLAALGNVAKPIAFERHEFEEREASWALYHRTRNMVEDRRDALRAALGDTDVARVDHMTERLRQFATYVSQDDSSLQAELRDQFSARNVLWFLDQLGDTSRIALWAHNGHIARGPGMVSRYDVLGHYLSRWFGDGYASVGFTFERGEVGAFGPNGFRFVEFGPAPEETFTAHLAALEAPFVALDVRAACASKTELAATLRGEVLLRTDLGESFSDESPRVRPVTLAGTYDALVHIATATRPTGIPWER